MNNPRYHGRRLKKIEEPIESRRSSLMKRKKKLELLTFAVIAIFTIASAFCFYA